MNNEFFKPEIRSGYPVSSDTKKIWAVQLDLLKAFDEFCKRNHIRYFAQGGTLIGAVRHKGFIPWDDDVDVVMLWDDYQTLLKLAPDYFVYPYYFQSYLNENEAEPTFSRLRRSDTTGCTKFELECITPHFNKGIFIDIFPLFNVPDDEEERTKQIKEIEKWWKLYKGYEVHREKQLNGFSKLEQDYEQYEELFLSLDPPMSFAKIKQKYMDACSACKVRTETVAPLSYRANNPQTRWPRKWFDTTVELPFEDIELPCPSNYLDMLRHQYGDWEKPVMDDKAFDRGYFDADIPFDEKFSSVYIRGYFSSDYSELAALLGDVFGGMVSQQDLEEHYLAWNKKIFVAVNKKKVIGCAFLSLDHDFIRNRRSSFVTYLAVDPNFRRMGVAGKLLREIEKTTEAYGYSAVELTSADFRTDAHEFYTKHGFSRKKTTVFIKELESMQTSSCG